jgi:hypothetical protein
MGIDGRNYLFIRGSKEILDQIEASGCILNNMDSECQEIADRFFSPDEINIIKRLPTYLALSYEFRNLPIYYYLERLLATYPTCWIKNTYYTETGWHGLWVGRFVGGKPSIQKFEWEELNDEEIAHVTDFSK